MLEPSTLIRKLVAELAAAHPGWSATKIAEHIDETDHGLVDELFLTRRSYILRWWVNDMVGEIRRDHRDGLKTGEILAALSPDGERHIHKLGDMTGYQVVALGDRYIASGTRLVALGEWYRRIGTEAGGKKIRTVFTDEQLREKQEEMGL